MNKEIKNSGFIFEKENTKDYILGANSPLKNPPVMFNDGHGWSSFRKGGEMQFNDKFDTFSCVVFSIGKALVAYLAKRYGIITSVAEMFNAFFADTIPGVGTTVRKGMESYRKYGWVKDEVYPFTAETTKKQYFSRPPLEIQIKAKGKLTKWKVNWEAIDRSGNVSHKKIKDALRYTPVICSGYAWASQNGIYKDYGNTPNHLFLVDDWADNEKYDLLAYDSYPADRKFDTNSKPEEFVKKLSKDYRIWSAHRIWLEPVEDNLFNKIKIMWNNFISYVDKHGVYSFFVKKDKDGTLKKQLINPDDPKQAVQAILTLLRENGLTKMMSKEEVKKIKDKKWF